MPLWYSAFLSIGPLAQRHLQGFLNNRWFVFFLFGGEFVTHFYHSFKVWRGIVLQIKPLPIGVPFIMPFSWPPQVLVLTSAPTVTWPLWQVASWFGIAATNTPTRSHSSVPCVTMPAWRWVKWFFSSMQAFFQGMEICQIYPWVEAACSQLRLLSCFQKQSFPCIRSFLGSVIPYPALKSYQETWEFSLPSC